MKQQDITYIDGFPRWGCYAASLASVAERHAKRPISQAEYQAIYNKAVQRGYIWHDLNPTDGSEGDWYRCFVANPVGYANLLFEHIGLSLRISKMRRDKTPGPDFSLICYKTRWGYHFALGDSNGKEVLNPDPNVPVLGVDSYRVFELRA